MWTQEEGAQVGVGPFSQYPDHLLVRRHLDELDGLGPFLLSAAQSARAPVGQHGVTMGQPYHLMNAEELDAGGVLVADALHAFSAERYNDGEAAWLRRIAPTTSSRFCRT